MNEKLRGRIRALVFDLDGTLIDSKQDLVLSVNAALRAIGRTELPAGLVASYVGSGGGARPCGAAGRSEARRIPRSWRGRCAISCRTMKSTSWTTRALIPVFAKPWS